MHKNRQKSGFSFVELSIVLVILGLLVGGILGGQSLIRAAELRSISVEYQQWVTAVNSFRQKYNALPGDMANATRFWGMAENCNNKEWDTGEPDPTGNNRTCNGNGSGNFIFHPGGFDAPEGIDSREGTLMWHHLHYAGLIPAFVKGGHLIGGAPSRLSNAKWSADLSLWTPPTSIFMLHAVNLSGTNIKEQLGLLPPEEAWNIDVKMDDGRPFHGNITTYPGRFQGATTGDVLVNCTEQPDGSVAVVETLAVNRGEKGVVHPTTDDRYKLGHKGNSCVLFMNF